MRPEPVTLKFGEREGKLGPLLLGQIRRLEPVLRDASLTDLQRSLGIMQIGLENVFPGISVDDLEMSFVDIGPTVQTILRMGGMVPAEESTDPSREAPEIPGI